MRRSAGSFAVRALAPIVVIDLLFAPLWFLPGYTADHPWLPFSQVFLSGCFAPLYLAVLGSVYVWRGWQPLAASTLGILAAASLLGVFLYYAVWGVSTHLFWHPDGETKILAKFLAFWALLVTLLPVVTRGFARRGGFSRKCHP